MRIPITKEQVTGHRYLEQRSDAATITGLPDSDNPPIMTKGGIGIVIVVVVLAIMFMLSKLSPQPDQGRSTIMMTQAGGLYVKVTGEDGLERVHPVLNLASARLIAGAADAPTIVKPDVLSEYTRGLPMGIPGAPNSLEHHSDVDAGWGVCAAHESITDLSLTDTDTLRTLVVAGADVWRGDKLERGAAVIVSPESDLNRRFLVFDTYVAEIGMQDYSIHTALGITATQLANPVRVSDAVINSLVPKPKIAVPEIADRGKPSEIARGAAVGDVLTTLGVDGTRRYYALLADGVQAIPLPVAEILSATGSPVHTIGSSEDVTRQRQVSEIDVTAYPENIPTISSPTALCSVWVKREGASAAERFVMVGNRLPIDPDMATHEVRNDPGTRIADGFVTAPGKGWFVRVTGNSPSSRAEAAVAYIDDTGVRYDVVADDSGSFTESARALGLTGEPVLIPDAVASILVKGSDLSRERAMNFNYVGEQEKLRGDDSSKK